MVTNGLVANGPTQAQRNSEAPEFSSRRVEREAGASGEGASFIAPHRRAGQARGSPREAPLPALWSPLHSFC